MGQDLKMGASEVLSLAQKISRIGSDRRETPWAEMSPERQAAAREDAEAAIAAGSRCANNETRVQIRLPANSGCGAVASVVSAMKEISDAGVICNLQKAEIKIDDRLTVVTALVRERKPLMSTWTPAPFPVALAVCAVASWAIREDPKQ